MSLDPTELSRISEQLTALSALRNAAVLRAADPPRLGADAWRGPAFEAYEFVADLLADDFRSIATHLGQAQSLARTELARGVA